VALWATRSHREVRAETGLTCWGGGSCTSTLRINSSNTKTRYNAPLWQGDRTILIIPFFGPGRKHYGQCSRAGARHAGSCLRAAALGCLSHRTSVDTLPGPGARTWALRLSCGVLVEAAEKALCDRISSLVRMVRSPCR